MILPFIYTNANNLFTLIATVGKDITNIINTGLAGNTKPQVTPIIVEPGRTMLPLRFIAENLGSKVDWDAGQKEVTVTYPAP
ncbi:MAG: copper amine oxidase N-terminal domain-containing protein [Peptococcaceae bacterium]|nr:copper amine oxidase N-terminal domain-containing protein [Peptococcaceae bacterium]